MVKLEKRERKKERKMDLTLDVEEYKLNIRAAGIIIHNHKILTHKNINKDHYCLPGGRVTIGENSEETVKREIFEELGKPIQVIGYAATIENFFKMQNRKYHEIFFIHQVEFQEEADQKIDITIHNKEGKEYLQYEWLDLERIEQYHLVPECLNQILKDRKFPIHVINDELTGKDFQNGK